MVVDNDYIIWEIRFLVESTADSVGNGLHTVADRDYDRRFNRKILLSEVRTDIVGSVYPRPNDTKMGGHGLFHLDLHVAVGGVDIVKLLDTTGPEVCLLFGIKIFVDVKQLAFTAEKKPQIIQSGVVIGRLWSFCRITVK